MKWYILTGALMAFPIFITMGIIGNIIGTLAFFIFNKTRSRNINRFIKYSIYILFIVGAIFFIIMGMFYASFALFLSNYIEKWIAISLIAILLLLIARFTMKEIRSLHNKNTLFTMYDFFEDGKYLKYSQVINQNILHGIMLLIPSFIFFLLFNNMSDKLSFGLNSFLISFFD